MDSFWSLFADCYYGSLLLLQSSPLWSALPLLRMGETVTLNNRRFMLGRKLGEGGYAVVHSAEEILPDDPTAGAFGAAQTARGRRCRAHYAMKRIFVAGGEQMEAARREVEALRALQHANVLPLLDWCVADGGPASVAGPLGAFASGGATAVPRDEPCAACQSVMLLFPAYQDGTLQEEIDRLAAAGKRLATSDVLQLLLGIASGLAHIHARGLAHRDIKPHNVLIRRPYNASAGANPTSTSARTAGGIHDIEAQAGDASDGEDDTAALVPSRGDGYEAVIMDFGSAREAKAQIGNRAEALSAQEEAEAMCTATYRAPELFDVLSCCTLDYATADVWSLGCTLYAVMYGASPFQVAMDAGASLALAVMSCAVPWPRVAPQDRYPDELHELVAACLAVDPAARPSAADVVQRLTALRAAALRDPPNAHHWRRQTFSVETAT